MLGRNQGRSTGPSAKHRFVEPGDPRSGLGVASVQTGLQQALALAVTDASIRIARCAMRGCGRSRRDAIHEPEE